MYRRFQRMHYFDMSQAMVTGLCLLLHILLKWGYSIPTTALDAFVSTYPQYHDEMAQIASKFSTGPAPPTPAYHQWFQEKVLEDPEKAMCLEGGLLHGDLLLEIARENPYSVYYTESCMRWIAERGIDSIEN